MADATVCEVHVASAANDAENFVIFVSADVKPAVAAGPVLATTVSVMIASEATLVVKVTTTAVVRSCCCVAMRWHAIDWRVPVTNDQSAGHQGSVWGNLSRVHRAYRQR